jgi:hypothetical protein
MRDLGHREQQVHFLLWYLRRHIHELRAELSGTHRPEADDIAEFLTGMLESVTLAEYLDAPVEEKIKQLLQYQHFVQTLRGADIHGNDLYRRGPDVD